MAWRIDEQVVRGEIDNRVKDRVLGRIWLVGREDPLALDLSGNCWRDLAGRKLVFTNPNPKRSGPEGLASDQLGTVGDVTASRKVKVPDIPMEEIGDYYAAKKPFPWHWGNSLYLEWFSLSNGRVVIESASYELSIAGDAAWEMSEEEEETQRRANECSMHGFMDTLAEGVEDADFEKADWDSAPQTEEEAEQLLHRNEILTGRIQARLEREGEDADFEQIMKSEIESLGGGVSETASEWESDFLDTISSDDLEDDDWDDEILEHELSERAQDLAAQLLETNRENNLIPEDAMEDHPTAYLLESVSKAAVKISTALDGRDWPPELNHCGMIIALLKRARVYLDDAITALESCQQQKLIEVSIMGVVFIEVIDIAKEADDIIADLRERLKKRS